MQKIMCAILQGIDWGWHSIPKVSTKPCFMRHGEAPSGQTGRGHPPETESPGEQGDSSSDRRRVRPPTTTLWRARRVKYSSKGRATRRLVHWKDYVWKRHVVVSTAAFWTQSILFISVSKSPIMWNYRGFNWTNPFVTDVWSALVFCIQLAPLLLYLLLFYFNKNM